jgi:hypothetical protein
MAKTPLGATQTFSHLVTGLFYFSPARTLSCARSVQPVADSEAQMFDHGAHLARLPVRADRHCPWTKNAAGGHAGIDDIPRLLAEPLVLGGILPQRIQLALDIAESNFLGSLRAAFYL